MSGCKDILPIDLIRCVCGAWDINLEWFCSAEMPFEIVKPYLAEPEDLFNPFNPNPIQEVSGSFSAKNKFRINYENKIYLVRSKPIFCIFKKNPYCVICNVKIAKCLLIKRKCKPNKSPHLIFTTDYYMPFNLDHIIPKSRNGPNIIENFATMCAECNSRKDNLTLDEYFQLYQKDKQCLFQ